MPINKYFEGHGSQVMDSMRRAHPEKPEKDVKSMFYATANSRNASPGQKVTGPPKKRGVGARVLEMARKYQGG